LVSPRLIGISLILLAIGIPIYAFFSPQKELVELKAAFWSAQAVSRRAYQQGQRFLAYPLRAIKRLLRRRSASEWTFSLGQSSRTAWAPLYPGAPVTPAPGCGPAPHIYVHV